MIIVFLIDYVINPRKMKKNLKECWTQLTLRMRETTRVRFPIRFLIFSIFSTRIRIQIELPVHTYSTYIRIISVTQESSGSIGNWACVEVVIWNTIFTVQLTLAYSNLASTRFPVHSVFKNFHYGERIRVDESQIRKYVWTKVQYSIFIKSPLRGSSDLIYKQNKERRTRERLINKSNC